LKLVRLATNTNVAGQFGDTAEYRFWEDVDHIAAHGHRHVVHRTPDRASPGFLIGR
jgi:hypothetical protein